MLSILAAFFTAALAGMGVGGGGLLILYLAFFTALSQQEAQGINLLCFLCSGGAGLLIHLKKRKLRLPVLTVFALAALLAAIPGCLLAEKITSSLLRRLFGALMAAGGLLSLFGNKVSGNKVSGKNAPGKKIPGKKIPGKKIPDGKESRHRRR